jgi:hypothetical protein
VPFFAHEALAFFAIVPSFFLVRESMVGGSKRGGRKEGEHMSTRKLLGMMLDARFRGFFLAQCFASMTRSVL